MYLFGREEIDAAVAVLERRQLFRYSAESAEAIAFERELARRLGARHALAVSSGTAALICALAAAGVGPGDEVLIPAYAFIADPLAVAAVGAVPVVCDIDESLTIDPTDVVRKVTPRTRAVIPVHMNGFPCDMDALLGIARAHRLVVVEDACQALGGTWRGRPLGTLGHAGVFSFNQFKILSAGEGGAVVTNSRTLYERAFIAHDGSCAFSPHRFTQPLFAGLAFRAPEITAAILRVQLRRLDDVLARLRETARRVREAIGERGRPIAFAPIRDQDGCCGTTVACRFRTADEAERFRETAAQAGLEAFRGDCFLHSYPEWTFLFTGAGGHHPGRNALAGRRYDPAACPTTSRILAQTVLLACSTTVDEGALARFCRALDERQGPQPLATGSPA